jgi:dihydrofolate reductase
LIDEIIVTISPKIFGYGISLFSDQTSMELELKEVERVGTDLVCLTYKVIK